MVIRLIKNINFIKDEILQTENQLLSELWGFEVNDKNKLEIWFELVSKNLKWIIEDKPVVLSLLNEKIFS